MSIAEDVEGAKPGHAGRPCVLKAWIERQSADDAAAVHRAIDGHLSAPIVAQIITKNGHRVSASTIRHHRTGQCLSCL